MNVKEVLEFRDDHLETHHGIEFYSYQKDASNAIIDAFFNKNGAEIPIAFSRQAGKTMSIIHTVEILGLLAPEILGRPITICIFAPQHEQASTDLDRLKKAYAELKGFGKLIEKNSRTMGFPNGSEIYIFPLTETSKPESKTSDLNIYEEAHNIDDSQRKLKADPMLASTGGNKIYVGSGGFNISRFYRLISKDRRFFNPYNKIIEARRARYEQDKDPHHLQYEVFVNREKEELGEDDDIFRANYKLDWILGTGQFITDGQFEKMIGDFSRYYGTKGDKSGKYWAGIDTAKAPDSTVVTIIGKKDEWPKKRICNWLELQGDNYKDQFDIIWDTLSNYNIKAVAIDSTAQGDFMPDMFERETPFRNEQSGLYRVKFSLPQKDVLYKNAIQIVRNLLTEIPHIDTKEAERFKQQILDLQKEYKGELLTCHHPDEPDAHDDYPDSWALAEHAYAKYQNQPKPDVHLY